MSYKNNTNKNWVVGIVALLLAAAMLIAYISISLAHNSWNPAEWVSVEQEQEELPDDEGEEAFGGMAVVPDEQFNGVRLMSRSLTAEQFDDYGISPLAESALVVTAEVEDENGNKPASYQYVTWSMAWASTKNEAVTDYVTMTTTDTTATFECLKAFDTQINVTVTSVLDPSKTATFTIDYYKRLTAITADLNDESYASIKNGDVIDVQFAPWSEFGTSTWNANYNFLTAGVFGTGSVENAITAGTVTVELTDEFKSALGNGFTYSKIEYSGPKASDIMGDSYNRTQSFIFDLVSKSAVPSTYGNDVMNALSTVAQDIKVTILVTTTHGDAVTFTYYLAVQTEASQISAINLSGLTNGGILF